MSGSNALPTLTKPHFIFISFGLKAQTHKGVASGDWGGFKEIPTIDVTLPKADLFFDCRAVVDGAQLQGKGGSGDSPKLQEAVVEQSPEVITSVHRIIEHAIKWFPARRSGEDDPYARPIIVAFFCAHGIHRSRSVKNVMAKRVRAAGYQVEVK